MLKTGIYIEAAADGLKQDISEIETFFRRINFCYIDKNHFFSLVTGDDVSDGASGERMTVNCDLAFFLANYRSSYGESTAGMNEAELPESYKAALESYNRTGKPKVFVYTKTEGSGIRGQGLPLSINSSLNTPSSTLFPSRPYAHIDTLKLGILMQIKQLDLDGVDIHLEYGKAWQEALCQRQILFY